MTDEPKITTSSGNDLATDPVNPAPVKKYGAQVGGITKPEDTTPLNPPSVVAMIKDANEDAANPPIPTLDGIIASISGIIKDLTVHYTKDDPRATLAIGKLQGAIVRLQSNAE